MHSHDFSAPAIEVAGLTKRFGARLAVDGVDLIVPRGTVYGLLGHNGAGKTTLIRMLLGLMHRSDGQVRLLGLPMPERRTDALARVGALVEEPKFDPHLTGRENLRIVADVRGLDARERIDGALHRVGLTNRADDRVKSYSLGMRQRLGVARTLLADPELLILDEPSNGLDPSGIVEFRQLIRSLAEDEGRTVFLSSHQLSEVEKVCDSAAIIDRGRVLEHGTIEQLAGRRRTGVDDRLRRPRRGPGDVEWLRPACLALRRTPPRRGGRRAASHRRRHQHPADRGRGDRVAPAAPPTIARAALLADRLNRRSSDMTTTLAKRMISSEILKLRKKRSTMLWGLFLGAGSMVIYSAYAALDHASDPAHHGPAGGALGFARSLQGLAILIGPLAAAMIGTESGAGDVASGVFRDLVATGRSRIALFLARIRRRSS